jgi:hypothetical protein
MENGSQGKLCRRNGMPYQLFHDLFPQVAEEETRTIIVLDDSDIGLPPGHYSFLEMFCNERGCDCRRVFFYVVCSFRKDPQAVIAWGWDTPEFYANWLGIDDPTMIKELKGPALNLASPATSLAPHLLDLVKNVLLRDERYVERVKRHYRQFRARIDGKSMPHSRSRKGTKKNRKR